MFYIQRTFVCMCGAIVVPVVTILMIRVKRLFFIMSCTCSQFYCVVISCLISSVVRLPTSLKSCRTKMFRASLRSGLCDISHIDFMKMHLHLSEVSLSIAVASSVWA
jgi:hypothetical protein